MKNRILLFFIFLAQYSNVFSIYFKHIGMSDGLSQTSIMSIHQDILGRMWFGTREGLTIYDGTKTVVYKPWSDEKNKNLNDVLYGNECDFLHSNKKGDIFFRSNNALQRYDIKMQRFHVIRDKGVNTLTSYNDDIFCVIHDSIFKYNSNSDSLEFIKSTKINNIFTILIQENEIWLGTKGGLYYISNSGETKQIISDKDIYSIFKSSNGEIWVGTRLEGLYRISTEGVITYFSENEATNTQIASNQVREIVEDNRGNIWFGTYKGLQKFDPSTEKFSIYTRNNLAGGLKHSSVFSLFIDQQGTIWAGTYYGGVNYFNPDTDIFSHYTDDPNRNDCLNFPFVGQMKEDIDGGIWVCTEGGGLNFLDRERKTFKYYSPIDSKGVEHNNLKSISYNKKNEKLYIGTHTGGLTSFHIPSKSFNVFLDYAENSANMPSRIIYHTEIYDDNLYISARNGLFKMDLKTEEFTYMWQYCVNFTIDANGYLWFGLHGELTKLNLKNTSDIKKFSLTNNGIRFEVTKIIEHEGNIYIGTLGSGFIKFNVESEAFTLYNAQSGHLISNYCYNMAITDSGRLLITGDKGVTFFDIREETSRFVQLQISLPISSITTGCGLLISNDGEIFVGGADGLTSFRESDLDHDIKNYSLFFSDISVNNEQIMVNDEANVLSNVLPFTEKITLKYYQNNFQVDFTSTNYVSIQRNNEYEYTLEGFEDNWNTASNYSIKYTNLNPGTYTLHVREKNSLTNNQVPQKTSLQIKIKRAWYNSFWSWLFYIIATLGTLSFLVINRNSRRKLALSLEREKEEKERNEKLNEAKMGFFTNITHEFRVPLTLISGHVDQLLQRSSLSPNIYNIILNISKNTNRMKLLINELLEFRKLKQDIIPLKVSEQNLTSFLKDIFVSFKELAVSKQIDFRLSIPDNAVVLWVDINQLQKVFFNLISNALKFVSDGGVVEIVLVEEDNSVNIQVIDNGIGLSEDEKKHVFDLFYQADGTRSNSEPKIGTGIGLSISQNIVQRHHGDILVKSMKNYGTIFTVELKKGKEHFETDTNTIILSQSEVLIAGESIKTDLLTNEDYNELNNTFSELKENERYSVLLVDDNREILEMLIKIFSPIYKVTTATNGEEGLKVALKERPDLIVSDVMMPKMTGTEMCAKIKNNINISHTPVLLLTALDSIEQNIEGLLHGADDYISKPFNSKMLLIRCSNIIRNRIIVQRKLKEQNAELSIFAVNSLDQDLLKRIENTVNEHLSDTLFDMDKLATELGLSRSSLFSKFKALTGITPNEYLRDQRLNYAASLLIKQLSLSIIEIAEEAGFDSPVYFSRVFKSKFGLSPSNYRKNSSINN